LRDEVTGARNENDMTVLREEHVFYAQQFLGATFDLRSQILFQRFDACLFVRCTILIDGATEQVAFTSCTFQDCNIDQLAADETRAVISYDNIFERPLAERKADFERRLAQALARRIEPAGAGLFR
jgi:hypothetical protein